MSRKPTWKRTRSKPKAVLRLPDLDQAKSAVLNSLTSADAQRGHRHAIEEFVEWYCSEPRLSFSRTVVLRYRIHLESRNLAPGTINLRLGAVRRLAYEAADCGLLSPDLAAGIRRVKGVKKIGVRLGNWLTAEQSQRLWQVPGGERLKEKRDRALLAVLLACGLRRHEAVELNFGHIQQREEHWAIVDLNGKAGHTRTIPMPGWVKNVVDQWIQVSALPTIRTSCFVLPWRDQRKRMFVGHFAIGFGAKRWAPRTSVGTLMFAALLADLLVFAFVAVGIEHISIRPGITRVNALNLYDFAWSHSLMMDVVWGALVAAAYFLTRRYGRGAWVLFAAVLSHWVLDWASHRPDMPLAPGFHRYYGIGLYNSPLGLLIVEGGLWVIGIIVYLRATHTHRFAGHLVLWTFIVVFTALWLLSFNGAPPPSIHVLVTVDLILFPIVFGWAYWIDRLRQPNETSAHV